MLDFLKERDRVEGCLNLHSLFPLSGQFLQAKATLQSIVDNYIGDQQLLQEAKNKLAQIKEEELESTKVDLNLAPSDTMQFDNFK